MRLKRVEGFLPLLWIACCCDAILITRKQPADTFTVQESCIKEGCLGRSSGTAALVSATQTTCTCSCFNNRPVFRDDLLICVDDIQDCQLVPFSSGGGSTFQKIPYVFLPLRGQIVHPSAELIFSGVELPICVVSDAKYLGKAGWENLRNNSDSEPPFRLFRDEGRSFLQWLGDSELRLNMEGRLILVNLMCKNMIEKEKQDIFTPCISFRVAGTPSEVMSRSNGVREVSFSVDSQGQGQSLETGYITVAVCSVFIGLIYITSILLYLKKKRKVPKFRKSTSSHLGVAEEGIVKNNPLLKHCHENTSYLTESLPSSTDCDDNSDLHSSFEDNVGKMLPSIQITSAIIHPCSEDRDVKGKDMLQIQESSNMERLPEENVSIVETLDCKEDRPESVRTMACSNGRRKLYFNPAYFEPELLLAPPPAAVEFLTKIREVISIAKAKMEAKRFFPSLMGIPEESDNTSYKTTRKHDNSVSVEGRERYKHRKNTTLEAHRPEQCIKFDEEYHSCCRTNELKQTSIRKWLENVPLVKLESDGKATPDEVDLKNSATQSIYKELVAEEKKQNEVHIGDITSQNSLELNNEIKKNFSSENKEEKTNCGSNKLDTEINKEEQSVTYCPEFNEYKNESDSIHSAELNVCQNNFKNINNDRYKNETYSSKTWYDLYEIDSLDRKVKGKKETCHENMEQEKTLLSNNNAFSENGKELNTSNSEENKSELNKIDDDYEMIIMNRENDETQSLPDMYSRTSGGYSLISEVYVNDGYGSASESGQSNLSSLDSVSDSDLKNSKEGSGHLTIKVDDDPPLDYCHDSDYFEPDTLDRKPNKFKVNQECNVHIKNSQDNYSDSLERPPQISLKTLGSFKSNSIEWKCFSKNNNNTRVLNRGFGSLREIFEAKNKYNQCTHNKSIKNSNSAGSTQSLNNESQYLSSPSWKRGKPKILRPEARQARRQRQPSPPNQSILNPPNSLRNQIDNLQVNENANVNSLSVQMIPTVSKPPLPPKSNSFKQTKFEKNVQLPASSIEHMIHVVPNMPSQILKSTIHFDNDTLTSPTELSPPNKQAIIQKRDKYKYNANEKNKTDQTKNFSFLQNKTEDSGYLSTDSNGSDVQTRIDDSISETDDSFFDGASESGAESIATDSFFFGRFHRCLSLKSEDSCTFTGTHFSDSDSNISHVTVLPS